MPFQSEKQRRFLWASKPELAQKWADEDPEADSDLPKYKHGKTTSPKIKKKYAKEGKVRKAIDPVKEVKYFADDVEESLKNVGPESRRIKNIVKPAGKAIDAAVRKMRVQPADPLIMPGKKKMKKSLVSASATLEKAKKTKPSFVDIGVKDQPGKPMRTPGISGSKDVPGFKGGEKTGKYYTSGSFPGSNVKPKAKKLKSKTKSPGRNMSSLGDINRRDAEEPTMRPKRRFSILDEMGNQDTTTPKYTKAEGMRIKTTGRGGGKTNKYKLAKMKDLPKLDSVDRDIDLDKELAAPKKQDVTGMGDVVKRTNQKGSSYSPAKKTKAPKTTTPKKKKGGGDTNWSAGIEVSGAGYEADPTRGFQKSLVSASDMKPLLKATPIPTPKPDDPDEMDSKPKTPPTRVGGVGHSMGQVVNKSLDLSSQFISSHNYDVVATPTRKLGGPRK